MIELTFTLLLDDEDVDLVKPHQVRPDKNGGGRMWYRQIMDRVLGQATPDDLFVDHINGNAWDNRRKNLRVATREQNTQNRRGNGKYLKGVTPGRGGKFRASIKSNGLRTSLGTFTTEEQAALAYDHAARERFGEFARLNFPDRDENPQPAAMTKHKGASSVYYGVHWMTDREKWCTTIRFAGKRIYVERFNDEVAAAKAYDAYVIEHGLDKPLNFPESKSE